jgi:hypothetical protein
VSREIQKSQNYFGDPLSASYASTKLFALRLSQTMRRLLWLAAKLGYIDNEKLGKRPG